MSGNDDRRDFDAAAAAWDDDPRRIRLSEEVATAILANVPLSNSMDIMDYGCGTGLVTFLLHSHVHSIIAADSSRGMLAQLAEKARCRGVTNIVPLYLNLEQGTRNNARFHAIVTSMTLHHVPEPQLLIGRLHALLLTGGYLAIADLDREEGQFHDDPTGVFHEGFDRAYIRALMIQAGFGIINEVTAATVYKEHAGKQHAFSVFLVTGRKT